MTMQGSTEDQGAAEALAREVYWVRDPLAGEPLSEIEELRVSVDRLARALYRDIGEAIPARDPGIRAGSPWKRWIKRGLHRAVRPVSRRYDRITAELARIEVRMTDLLRQVEIDQRRMEEELAALRDTVRALSARSSAAPTGPRGT
jgi:hypothetical protein